jgi:hypothetical protein
MTTTEKWLGKLAKLKVDKARGDPAPHKPLLVLVVLEFAENEPYFGEVLPLTPELAIRFCTYWGIVAHRRTQAPDVRYPFFHLKSDGFWSPLEEDGKLAVDRRLVRSAILPLDCVAFARDPAAREQARRILIAKYFQPGTSFESWLCSGRTAAQLGQQVGRSQDGDRRTCKSAGVTGDNGLEASLDRASNMNVVFVIISWPGAGQRQGRGCDRNELKALQTFIHYC